jgi:hypothetical protein
LGGQQANYREFVAEGIGKTSVWEDLKGQIYLGNDTFLERMQNLVDRKAVHGIAKAQTKPLRPSVGEIVATVGRIYGIPAPQVLDKSRSGGVWVGGFSNAPGWESFSSGGCRTGRSFACQDFTDPSPD